MPASAGPNVTQQPIPLSWVCMLAAAWILPGLIGHDPWKPDEAYTFGLIYNALNGGDWVVPMLAHEAFMIFPAAYAALLVTLALDWARWVDAGSAWRLLAAGLPVLAAASDYAENVLLLGVLAALPRRMPARIAIASVFTTIKHLSVFATFATPLLHWAASATGWLA